MSKEVTIWVVIGVYALFMLGIGVWYSRKGTDMAGFTVGGRSAGAGLAGAGQPHPGPDPPPRHQVHAPAF